MRHALVLLLVVTLILFPLTMLIQRIDQEHNSKRQQAERWSINVGWRPLSVTCQLASKTTLFWGSERCVVTALHEDGDIFSVNLGCDASGCAYWSMQQIR